MELLNINGRGMYYGLSSMTPGLYKGHFKGGIDVTDISGTKYKCKAYYGFQVGGVIMAKREQAIGKFDGQKQY